MQTRRAGAITTRVPSEDGGSKAMDVEPAPVAVTPPALASPHTLQKSAPLSVVGHQQANAVASGASSASEVATGKDQRQLQAAALHEVEPGPSEATEPVEAPRKALRLGAVGPAAQAASVRAGLPWARAIAAVSPSGSQSLLQVSNATATAPCRTPRSPRLACHSTCG
jgi:hypothetical protein